MLDFHRLRGGFDSVNPSVLIQGGYFVALVMIQEGPVVNMQPSSAAASDDNRVLGFGREDMRKGPGMWSMVPMLSQRKA